MEEFNAILDSAWDDPPEEGASEEIKAKYKKQRADLTWYVEQWLPRCVDDKWYGVGHRPHERLSNLVTVDNGKRERVSATREGYGYTQFENSREVWLNKFEWDDDQKKSKKKTGMKAKSAPNYSHKNHEATKKFKAKWSDYGAGQQSKWDPNVYAELQLKIDKVEAWRKEDKKKNYKGQDLFIELSRERQGISDPQENPTSNKKKRSRANHDDDEDYVAPTKPQTYVFRLH